MQHPNTKRGLARNPKQTCTHIVIIAMLQCQRQLGIAEEWENATKKCQPACKSTCLGCSNECTVSFSTIANNR
jgi:hypothetical protein